MNTKARPKTQLNLSADHHTMTVEATTRKGLQRECNRLGRQVGWELDSSEVVEGAEMPYKATMVR